MLTSRSNRIILRPLGVVVRSNLLRITTALKSSVAFNNECIGKDSEHSSSNDDNFSNTISFASPESDFSTPHLLFKSTYSDFDSEPDSKVASKTQTCGNQKPITDLKEGVTKQNFFETWQKNNEHRNDMAYTLSFATPENDFINPDFSDMLSTRMKEQLHNSSLMHTNVTAKHDDANQLSSFASQAPPFDKLLAQAKQEKESTSVEYNELRAHAELLKHEDPLPVTMEEAMKADEKRAIVITEAQIPFRIVSVNCAWEHLCGYKEEECIGETLKCIQGKDTNRGAITALMSQLLRGEEAGTVLVNYRKDGSKFLNRLRVGSLKDSNHKVTHFVGVLKEVEEMSDHFYSEGSKILA